MNRVDHIKLMADYNAWMNQKIYAMAHRLTETELLTDKGAFFGSILGTLNHILVGDIVWLQRFAQLPSQQPALADVQHYAIPATLGQLLYTDLASLEAQRVELDQLIQQWVVCLVENDLDEVVEYRNMQGVAHRKPLFSLIMHLFNHQTHHRGQITTIYSQLGYDVGVTDLLELIGESA